jgi:hypothetical protein
MNNLKDIFEVDVTIEWSPTDCDNPSRRAELYSARRRIKQICCLHGGKLSYVADAILGYIFGSLEPAEEAANDLRSAADLRLAKVVVCRLDQPEVNNVADAARYWHLTAVKRLERLGLNLESEIIIEARDFWPIDVVRDTCAEHNGKFSKALADGDWADVHYVFAGESEVCAAQQILEDHGFGVDVHEISAHLALRMLVSR